MSNTSGRIEATLIPGDGIGPEVVEAARTVLDALGSPFVWDVRHAGVAAMEQFGDPLPPETLQSIRRTKLALKGPLTTPVGGGFRSIMSACAKNSAYTPMSVRRGPSSPASATTTSTSC
jgi:isocitrate dehydrogenase (NAD+)